ncbi:hypothetical protein PRECH8_18200 [Insulibacter thermoxylanivorax]|uniref:Uncharacterized protein n=1 Tax=Insulibacter thermoxylanivorax TaxID=2749268 RepID=A0A916VGA6_9BACL|nr:hypothetical protein PRECH8_18200 [Insulibacter thermoxylanivorax]
MKTIISELEKIIHQTKDLIDFEEQVRLLMYDTFARMVGDVFTSMNRVISMSGLDSKHMTGEVPLWM